jgi:hypothetical protein
MYASAEFQANVLNAQILYHSAGVDIRLLEVAMFAVDPLCVSNDIAESTGQHLLRVAYRWWIPSFSYLRTLGLDITGYEAASPESAEALLLEHMGIVEPAVFHEPFGGGVLSEEPLAICPQGL